MRGDWTRYRFKQQCPVCGHCGWCMYKGQLMSPTAVLCARVSDGCAKRKDGSLITAAGGQGWIHDLKKDPKFKPRRHPVPTNKPKVVVHPMMADLAREFHGAMNDLEMEALGEQLGVSAESLKRLRVGWCKRYMHHPLNYVTGELGDTVTKHAKAFAFPMRDARQRIIGIRFRNQKGYKWAAECSINGLFIPVPLNPDGPLLIVEGPTETAAATDLGFAGVGRPANTSGCEYIVQFCKQFLPRRGVVIFLNNDPRGSDAERLTRIGAETLSRELKAQRAAAWIKHAKPETKDLREWKNKGATHADVQTLINRTPLWTEDAQHCATSKHRPALAKPAHSRGSRASCAA
jgi:hypothetical protein